MYLNHYLNPNNGIRFYSAHPIPSKQDDDVLQRENVERLGKLWLSSHENPQKIYYDLRGYLKDVNIWIIAYQKQAKSKGATTRGTDNDTIDGINIKKIISIQKSVLEGKYKWKPSRRVWIPKGTQSTSNKNQIRPLGIGAPSFSDKLVESVLLLILEPIYEFDFDERSFGFRAEKSTHKALKYIATTTIASKWCIEGDISKCFDKINHKKLMKIIKERIKDKLVLKLIQGNLKSPIHDDGKLTDGNEGTRQGGVLSPLLCNIYLDKLDKEIRKWEEQITIDNPDAHKRLPNKKYYKINYLIQKRKLPKDTKNLYPQKDKSRTNFLKLEYVRYADDFILFVDGNLEQTKYFKDKLKTFIKDELQLELNELKTKITWYWNSIKFLGHSIIKRFVWRIRNKNQNRIPNISVSVDIPKLIRNLNKKGFCNEKGFPILHPAYLGPSQADTNYIINCVINGYYEWFKLGKNRQTAIDLLYYILKFSIAKTYAAKFKLGTIAKVFKRGGSQLNKPLRSDEEKTNILGVDDKIIEEWKTVKRKNIPGIKNLKYAKFDPIIQKYTKKRKETYICNNNRKRIKWGTKMNTQRRKSE